MLVASKPYCIKIYIRENRYAGLLLVPWFAYREAGNFTLQEKYLIDVQTLPWSKRKLCCVI